MLIAVAIIAILAGIAFISIARYQRNLRLLEMNNIAKDIFIVSQNHLSEADAAEKIKLDSYVGVTGDKAEATLEENLRILRSSKGTTSLDVGGDPNDYATLLIPVGAIDAHVRNGYFTVRFDPVTATVLEVFYSENYDVTEVDYSELEAIRDDTNARRNYDGGGIIGYYGDTNGLDKRTLLGAPKIVVHNDEVLYVEIVPSQEYISHFSYEPGSGTTVRVSIQDSENSLLNDITFNATTSNSKVSDGKIYVVIDDISSNINRIGKLLSTAPTLIGNDINVRVEITDSTHYGNMASSAQVTVNSLFGERDEDNNVSIDNMRHFINLGADSEFTSSSAMTATQKTNMNWDDFTKAVETIHKLAIEDYDPDDEDTHFIPPVLYYSLEYDGKKLSIDGISETTLTTDAGLFGKTTGKLEVHDLEIKNMNLCTTTGYAGALLGSAEGSGEVDINSVIAYNTKSRTETDPKIEIATSGNGAGGLIGNMIKGSVKNSAAAVYVSGNTVSGGLVGTMANGTIENCYAGGHTSEGKYLVENDNKEGRPNVVATGTTGMAGGLVGSAGSTATITNSYATTSVMGKTMDPLANGITSDDSTGFGWYCDEELIEEDADNAFPDVTKESAFINGGTSDAMPYDTTLRLKKYPFQTINEIDSTANSWFMKEHVGDWALPGEVVDIINYPE